MEVEVRLVVCLPVVDRRSHVFQCRPQLIEVLVAAAGRDRCGHRPFQSAAHRRQLVEHSERGVVLEKHGQHDGIEDVPGCRGLHARATALDDRDQALLLDALDRFADDGSTHAEMCAQVAFGRERLPGCDLSRDDGTDQVMDHGDAEPCRGGTCVACGEKCAAAGRRCSLTHSVSVSSGQMAIGRISRSLSRANRPRDADPLGGSARAALPSRARLRCAGSERSRRRRR